MYTKYAIQDGAGYVSQEDPVEMYLGNQWGANLAVTGADGLPPIQSAGNVLRASTSVRLSMRLSPAMDAKKANEIMEKILTTDVPYNAKVTL
jgi:hypothetical protein